MKGRESLIFIQAIPNAGLYISAGQELDGVGSNDNILSSDWLHHILKKIIEKNYKKKLCVMWFVTHDMCHREGGESFLKISGF